MAGSFVLRSEEMDMDLEEFAAEDFEMVPTPGFSFPMLPQPSSAPTSTQNLSSRRPVSMHINSPFQPSTNVHKRAASTLPSFSFNAQDTSGRKEESTPPRTPDENAPPTPSRRGHRRGGSEFIGGDPRFGTATTVSATPANPAAQVTALPISIPITGLSGGRRGHAHRRSAAISSHDLGSIMQSPDPLPRLSSSLPSSPLEHPLHGTTFSRATSAPDVHDASSSLVEPSADAVTERPSTRPRVGFSDNVEYISRPLSTVSSETESSISTIRGHSLNNSISSMLSLGASSPPPRTLKTSLNATLKDDAPTKIKSSLEISRRVEKEGEWLKSRSSESMSRPFTEPAVTASKTTGTASEATGKPWLLQRKKQSTGYDLGFDRRKSEPSIGLMPHDSSRTSSILLQESASSSQVSFEESETRDLQRKSSTKKIKAWAAAKISRKPKESQKSLRPRSSPSLLGRIEAGDVPVPGGIPVSEAPVARTDLDAVFNSESAVALLERTAAPSQPRIEVSTASPFPSTFRFREELDDPTTMLDLDSALDPFNTASFGQQNKRRELHSSRLTKDFGGPSGNYHRRSESAPNLSPFEFNRFSTPSQSSMDDVFEEEEEDESPPESPRPFRMPPFPDEMEAMGTSVGEWGNSAPLTSPTWNRDRGLGIRRGLGSGQRTSFIRSETIAEEGTPVEAVEIVGAYEEPRASSLEKSSDSSDTPTIAAAPTAVLTLPDVQHSVMTPDTYQTSTFSSPDFTRRQGSFETSRLGTSASSVTDNRTISSCMTNDPAPEVRISMDDVPSLTSSRSTMLSSVPVSTTRRETSGDRTPSGNSDPTMAAERRQKRASIQSFSQLMGGSFGNKSKGPEDERPVTSAENLPAKGPKKRENRLRKLMFWKPKNSKRCRQLDT